MKISLTNDRTLSSLLKESTTLKCINLEKPVDSPVYRQHFGAILFLINALFILITVLFLIIKFRKNKKSKMTNEKPGIISPVLLNIIGSSQNLERMEMTSTFPPPPPPLEPTTLFNYRK
jgi:hypothetical protein